MTSPKTVTPDQPQAVPDMVLVPREPTAEMVEAAINLHDGARNLRRQLAVTSYAAMVAARPVLPVETPAEGLREALEKLTQELAEANAELEGNAKEHAEEIEQAHAEGYDEGLEEGRSEARSAHRGVFRFMYRWLKDRGLIYDEGEGINANDVEEGLRIYKADGLAVERQATAKALTLAETAIRERNEARAALASTVPAPLSGRDGSLLESQIEWLHVDFAAMKLRAETAERERDEARAALAAVPPETAEMEGEPVAWAKPRGKWVMGSRFVWADERNEGWMKEVFTVPLYVRPADRLAARASSSGEAGDE